MITSALNGLVARYGNKTYNGALKYPHLAELGLVQPQLADKILMRIFEHLPQDDYVKFYNEFPVIELDNENSFYYWRLAGNNIHTAVLMDWYDASGNKPASVGQNHAQWFMVFNEKFYNQNDIIVGHDPDNYYVRVVEEPENSVNGDWIYKVKLVTNNTNMSMPATELFQGSRWSKETNFQSGERSYTGTETHMNTFIEMKARPAVSRMKYKVSGNVIDAGKNIPLVFGLPDPKDPSSKKPYTGVYVNYYDILARYELMKQRARAFFFSHMNYDSNEIYYDIDGKNGCTIATFAGMFKQIAATNIHPQTTFNLDRIVDMAIDMGLAYKLKDQYFLEIETGTFGFKEGQQWIEQRSTQYTPNFVTDRVRKNGDMGGEGLTYGGVFTQFKSYNGVNIKFKVRPMFDDTERYKAQDPSGYGTIASRHMLIRSSEEFVGNPSIYRLGVKGYSNGIYNYIPGMRNPFSPGGTEKNMGKIVSPEDAYEVHGMEFTGCVVKDPTKILYLPREY